MKEDLRRDSRFETLPEQQVPIEGEDAYSESKDDFTADGGIRVTQFEN